MNQCIHGIDLLRWMMGDEIDCVYGATRRRFHPYIEAEDVGLAVVSFKNGAIATIEGSLTKSARKTKKSSISRSKPPMCTVTDTYASSRT